MNKDDMPKKALTPTNIINGNPSKELFKTMLTRDISLIDAISDLVDNCIDGAIRQQDQRDYSLKGYCVDISITKDMFRITDNCGGMEKDLAQNYAFRFGRAPKTPSVNFSVGQFGIGMKRALFKIGNKFEIASTTTDTTFSIEIDVADWLTDPDKWDFKFKSVVDKKSKKSDCGTDIKVTLLDPDVKERFAQHSFLTHLHDKLELHHLTNITRGLVIKINDTNVKPNTLKLLNSNKFKTAYFEESFPDQGGMKVRIYAGLGEDSKDEGGWYIFCNNRLILGPEQTSLSAWGVDTPVVIPKYHLQFSRFRGFVFFEAKKPDSLPWNTSKNNIDIDSPVYQNIRLEMIKLTRPVITFLNKVHAENVNYLSAKVEDTYLQKEMDAATLTEYSKVKLNPAFVAPVQTQKSKKNNTVSVQYLMAKDKVEKMKKVLRASSASEVGEKTFDYTYKRECAE